MLNWGDLYSGQQISVPDNGSEVPTIDSVEGLATTEWESNGQDVDLDEGGKAILSMIAEDFRAVAETQLRPMLSLIRASVDKQTYSTMCADMVAAAKLYHAGDREGALSIMGAYMPREMIEAMAEKTPLV